MTRGLSSIPRTIPEGHPLSKALGDGSLHSDRFFWYAGASTGIVRTFFSRKFSVLPHKILSLLLDLHFTFQLTIITFYIL